uniref:Coiled-coil domain-containing protein R3HCC1L n=1 Tax=Cacopsylla melanoneura TaxID=428564 RepID=A0A8D8UK63_9HEMI
MNIYTPPHLRRINGMVNSGVGEGNSSGSEGLERRCLTSSENLERKCKTEPATSKISRARRPDLKVYVPRALRTSLPASAVASQTNSQNSTNCSQSAETSPRNTSATSQVRSNDARNMDTVPTQSKGCYAQQSDQSSDQDSQSSENNETPATAIHTNIPSISHTHFNENEPTSSESKEPVENSINSFIELVTEDSQELGAEQNETLKILNLPQESAPHHADTTDTLKDKYSSEHSATQTCNTSEINAQCTNMTAGDVDMEVDEIKQVSGPSPVDMDTSDMIELEQSNNKITCSDKHINTCKDNGVELQEDIDVPHNEHTQLVTVSVSESMNCDSCVNGDDNCNKMESNVPERPENTDELANKNCTEVSGNEACALNTSDIDNEVPNKVRVVETYSNDSDCSVITRLVSDSTSSEIVPVTDTIANGNKNGETLLRIIAGCQTSNLQPISNSKCAFSSAEPMLSEETKSVASLSNQTFNTTESIPQPASERIKSDFFASEPDCETSAPCSSAVNVTSESLPAKSNSEICPSKTASEELEAAKSSLETTKSSLEVTKPSSEGVPPSTSSTPATRTTGSTTTTPVGKSAGSTDGKSSPVNLSLDDCDWDTLYDDDGDCLVPDIMNEVMSKMGKVSVQSPTEEYSNFQSTEERTCDGENILEIYGFSSSFTNRDLMDVFAAYQRTYFHLKWVDDTHALGVFSSPLVADEVLNTNLPNVKTRPLKEATLLSKAKAKTLNLIATPLPRPKTCLSSARRLVSGALGIRVQVSETKREEERQMLRDAREKKRQEAKQRQEIWDKD